MLVGIVVCVVIAIVVGQMNSARRSRNRDDEIRYKQQLTPRKPGSNSASTTTNK